MNKIVILSEEAFQRLLDGQKEIKEFVKNLGNKNSNKEYLVPKEFMGRAKIGRSKFDQLIAQNEIDYIRKGRKIYIPSSEVDKYFNR